MFFCPVIVELQESSEDTQKKFQAEKQSRRQLDGKVAALEEELADLRMEKENLERVGEVQNF